MERDRSEQEAAPRDQRAGRDEVDEASEESFPASDPPSWDPLHAGSPSKEHEPRRERRDGDT